MKNKWMRALVAPSTAFWAVIGTITTPGAATYLHHDDWSARKCSLYESAVRDAITLQGPEGLRVEFLTENQKFIDAGCKGRAEICPMTQEEWKLADNLLKMTMNEGMASTFVPFGCP